MFQKLAWLPYIAAACACFLLAGQFWYVQFVREAFLTVGILATIGAGVVGYKKRRDPYDLGSLQEIHEREELRNLDVPAGHDIDQVQCMCCQRVYAVRYPACPHCAEKR